MKRWQKVLLNTGVLILVMAAVGLMATSVINALNGKAFKIKPQYFLEPKTWLFGFVGAVVISVIWLLSGSNLDMIITGKGKSLLGGKKGEADVVKGSLENSRFLTDQERDKYFPEHVYSALKNVKKDGIPVRAVLFSTFIQSS